MKKNIGLSIATGIVSMFIFAAPALAATISTQMDIGTRSADVTTFQQTLAASPSIYPQGLVTGYFGAFSSAAAIRFQAQQGISPQVGRVGLQTIAAFNRVYGGTSIGASPAIFNASTTQNGSGVNLMWNTDQSSTGIVYYSTSPLLVSEATGPGQVPGITGTNVQTMNTSLSTSNSISLTNLASSATYYYMIASFNSAGQMSVTWPSTFQTR